MTERIQLGPVRGNFLARRAFQTFADDHDAIFQRGNGFFDLGQEFVLQEGNFRYQDEVGRVNGTALRQHGAGGDPPCPAAHDLDDATGAVVRDHAADVRGDFHHGRRIVFDDRAVAGAMVGVWQVVVDGFGNADHAHFKAAFDGLVVNLVRGILRIVAAGVKEVADIVRLKNLKEAVHAARDMDRLFQVFQAHNIRYLFYAGGNDSQDTAHKIHDEAIKRGFEMRVIGVPKTIDNDLPHTDHCPGYGSVIKYNATTVMEIAADVG